MNSQKSHVELKNKSIVIDEKPVFINGGEFISYRLPACLWRDRLEKLKASGFNTVSIYWAWNFHSSRKCEVDLSSEDRNVKRLLDEAGAAGLYVIARPGPYVCNEWDLGGYPGWLMKEDSGDWRSGDPKHVRFCREWYGQINKILSKKQFGDGGPVILYQIENEHRWNDREFLGALCDAAVEDGIKIPLVGNHDGGGLCVTDKLTEGTDIYTPTFEFFRWRGWLDTLLKRVGDDKPLMILEYRCGEHPLWGEAHVSAEWPPAHWTISQDRLFIAKGANLINHFVGAGGITPIGYNSDHIPTSYVDTAPVSPWGQLTERFYEHRLLAEFIDSFNEELSRSRTVSSEIWRTDNNQVECLERRSEKMSFLFIANVSKQPQEFVVRMPDGKLYPKKTKLAIAPYRTQILIADAKFANGLVIKFCPFEILKSWTTGNTIKMVVFGEEGANGELILESGGKTHRINLICSKNVSHHLENYGDRIIEISAVSRELAKTTWFMKTSSGIVPLFSNCGLMRPQKNAIAPARMEISAGKNPSFILPAGIERLKVSGKYIPARKRSDGLGSMSFKIKNQGKAVAVLSGSKVRIESDWMSEKPSRNEGWMEARAYGKGREILVDTGDYEWRKDFNVPDPLPEVLEFAAVNQVEITVWLNGRLLGAYPEKRLATRHACKSHNAVFDVRGIIVKGSNQLAVHMHFHGRHNAGQPVLAGLDHPVFLRNSQRLSHPLPSWKVSPPDPKKWNISELDGTPAEASARFKTTDWEKLDLSKPDKHRRPADTQSWREVRWYRSRINIPSSMRNKPLLIEFPNVEEAWCYVDGKNIGRSYSGTASTFDLTPFSGRKELDIVLAVRHNWYFFSEGFGLNGLPHLVSFNRAIDEKWLLLKGTQGIIENWAAKSSGWKDSSAITDSTARVWFRYDVRVEKTENLIAPLFIEMKDWGTRAILYWNGEPFALYNSIGPETRFYVHEGRIRGNNTLVIAVDGYGKPVRKGSLKTGFYFNSTPFEIGALG